MNTNTNTAPAPVDPDTLAAALAAALATDPAPADVSPTGLAVGLAHMSADNLTALAAALAAAPAPVDPAAAAAVSTLAVAVAVARVTAPDALVNVLSFIDDDAALAALGLLDAIDAELVAMKTAAAPAQNATLAALAAHNAAPRKSYKLTAGDTLAALTLDGVTAYYAETLEQWARGFAGTAYAVKSAETARKCNKRGDYIEVVVKTVNYGTVHITTNSTTSVDYRRLTASYVKKCDNRAARAANKSAGSGRRAPMSDVKRAAQAVNRYAAAAVKRLDGDKRMNEKVRTMVTNHLSSVCVERDVNRADVVAALNDATRAFVS